DGLGGARRPGEQGDPPKTPALGKEVDHDVFALGGRDADLDRPGEPPHQPGAGISFREEGVPARPPTRLHVRAEMLDHRRGKVAKQGVIAQQSQLVTRAFRRPLAAWNRHESSPVQTNLAIRTALSNTPATTS